MSVVKVNKSNFEQEVLNSEKKVLLDFYAEWCNPCRMLGPILDELASEHPEYKVCKVNIDEEKELASRFEVMSIPSLFVMEKGEIVNSSLGLKPKAQLLKMLN
ncbi:MAG: thioredoxin [Ruminococcaceae bacterium]|nr:thioredoxin [Oscillospiraceae bacterium]